MNNLIQYQNIKRSPKRINRNYVVYYFSLLSMSMVDGGMLEGSKARFLFYLRSW